jgi:diazepam-binding inhibitor (GABA receptor modulating acyl-CoA-binding protein)
MSLKDDFESAVTRVKTLRAKPSDDDLLSLYSLYKQATSGDVSGDKPGLFDFVAKAKYEAWAKLRGTSPEEAMQRYVALVDALA